MTLMVRKCAVSYLSSPSMDLTKTLLILYYLAFDNLFATVTFLLQNSPGSIFITSYHNRRYFSFYLMPRTYEAILP